MYVYIYIYIYTYIYIHGRGPSRCVKTVFTIQFPICSRICSRRLRPRLAVAGGQRGDEEGVLENWTRDYGSGSSLWIKLEALPEIVSARPAGPCCVPHLAANLMTEDLPLHPSPAAVSRPFQTASRS